MQHKIPVDQFGAQGPAMANAIESCVHCGFCLPTCPTYQVLGEEMNSPRGRIFLMKEVLEGNLPLEEALPYTDKCLGCLACVTSCPSGVQYGELISPFRAYADGQRKREPFDKLSRLMIEQTLPYPNRFRLAASLGKFGLPFKKFLPPQMQSMLELLPASLPVAQSLPEVFPAEGERRARVALLAGCAQQVLAPEINWATLRVLARNGVEVVIPKSQGCCGAILMHTGAQDHARDLARNNLRAFTTGVFGQVDAIVTNAAGCGSGMHEYPLLFAGHREEKQARALAARVKDVSVFLDELGLREMPVLEAPLKLAYHDACHLAHAQGVRSSPRKLLSSIDGLELLEVRDSEICCGSAGTYNIEQPDIARELGERKAQAVIDTGAQAVASGNIGCLTQLTNHLEKLGHALPVLHTMEILDLGYPVNDPGTFED
jgi:glycolate oxidase iron-sulfur subunit